MLNGKGSFSTPSPPHFSIVTFWKYFVIYSAAAYFAINFSNSMNHLRSDETRAHALARALACLHYLAARALHLTLQIDCHMYSVTKNPSLLLPGFRSSSLSFTAFEAGRVSRLSFGAEPQRTCILWSGRECTAVASVRARGFLSECTCASNIYSWLTQLSPIVCASRVCSKNNH